ncbi:MAG: metallophosphoesterase [Bacteroidota bacterium]
MKNKVRKIIVLLLSVIILIDLLTMRGINLFLDSPDYNTTLVISIIHWGISFFFILRLFAWLFIPPDMKSPATMRNIHRVNGAFVLFYVPKIIFVSCNVVDELIFQTARFMSYSGDYLLILSWPGLVLGGLLFVLILYGIVIGKTQLNVRRHTIESKHLPKGLDGLKLIHISDYHLGSFTPKSSFPARVTSVVNRLDADLILFTGDLINNTAAEAKPFQQSLKDMKASKGKYAVTGNHDYGHYVRWSNEEEKQSDQHKLEKVFSESGFRLLKNEGIRIDGGDTCLGLLGVENWGVEPFPQYADLKKTLADVKACPYHILLSHDPSHWDYEVLEKTNIGLTLSGHTHGFQFGFRLGKLKWSPVQYKYTRWTGLVKEGNQYLHISPGLGFIGFPGRVGIHPEIGCITLKRTSS